jgi:hypothetical protein
LDIGRNVIGSEEDNGKPNLRSVIFEFLDGDTAISSSGRCINQPEEKASITSLPIPPLPLAESKTSHAALYRSVAENRISFCRHWPPLRLNRSYWHITLLIQV